MHILKDLRVEQHINQEKLAKAIGVSRSTIAMWETGASQPDNDMLRKLSQHFHVTTDYLLGNESPSVKGVKIPVLGRVQAGIPIEAIEEIIDYEEITKEMAEQGQYFALQIKGDSMQPRMLDGDVIIVQQNADVENGDVAVILVNGDEATVKKIKRTDSGIQLIPYNPSYDIFFYTNEEIERLPVRIIGKVVELRGKL